MGKLKNKVAVVTGASRGIGAAIAKAFAAEGATVVVNYSSDEVGANSTVKAIAAAGGTAVAVRANIVSADEIATLFSVIKQRFGRVDILVNNAGVYAFTPLESVNDAEFSRMFDLNVRGVLLATRAAIPLFPETGGSIVNVSSFVTSLAPAGLSVYSATKGAVDVITKTLAKELAEKKIRVNAVAPGLIDTEGAKAAGFVGSNVEKFLLSITPLGRTGRAEDVALPAVFLASQDAAFITGETLHVSGGLGM